MKKIYKMMGLIVVISLIIVGCSTDDPGEKDTEQETPITQEEKDTGKDEDEEVEKEKNKDEEEIYSSRLVEMMTKDHYTMKMNSIVNLDGQEMETLVTTVVADGQSATIIESGEVSMTSIIKDDKAYMLMHNEKTVIVTPVPEDEELGLDEIDFDNIEYVEKGREDFLGNERVYEEYKADNSRMRYYFDGKELDGMKIIYDEETAIIDVVSFTDEVDMSVFEIPEDYEKISY